MKHLSCIQRWNDEQSRDHSTVGCRNVDVDGGQTCHQNYKLQFWSLTEILLLWQLKCKLFVPLSIDSLDTSHGSLTKRRYRVMTWHRPLRNISGLAVMQPHIIGCLTAGLKLDFFSFLLLLSLQRTICRALYMIYVLCLRFHTCKHDICKTIHEISCQVCYVLPVLLTTGLNSLFLWLLYFVNTELVINILKVRNEL